MATIVFRERLKYWMYLMQSQHSAKHLDIWQTFYVIVMELVPFILVRHKVETTYSPYAQSGNDCASLFGAL